MTQDQREAGSEPGEGEQRAGEGEKRIPAWARKPFGDFIEFVEDLFKVTRVSAAGLAIIQKQPEWVELLGVDSYDDEYESRLAAARETATLAKREVENEFPLLHRQFVVAVWSGLESLTNNLLVAWLQNDRAKVVGHQRLQAVKVPLSEYGQLSHDEQTEYLAELIDRSLNAPLKEGTTRFDAVLELLDLDGPLEQRVRDAIFELGQVRNLIVHRGGIVDKRFVEKCPRYGASVGEHIKIDRGAVSRYFAAAVDYAGLRLWRAREVFGLPPRPWPPEVPPDPPPKSAGDRKTGGQEG